MIARIWRGATRKTDASAYVDYLRETGLREYRATPGNQGAWVLWREAGERVEFMTWVSPTGEHLQSGHTYYIRVQAVRSTHLGWFVSAQSEVATYLVP